MKINDLQSLLAQKFGEDIKLIRYNTSKFLANYENFCSTVIKLEATIKKLGGNESEETIHVVAKLLEDHDEIQRVAAESANTFETETFFYTKVKFLFDKVADDVFQGKIQSIFPQFYGARVTDNDSIILLEDLITKNYYMVDKLTGK